MTSNEATKSPVRWEFSSAPNGATTLRFSGDLDATTTPDAWRKLEAEIPRLKSGPLTLDTRGLSSCDSAGLALLHFISADVPTTIIGLNADLQHMLKSFSSDDLKALQDHEPRRPSLPEEVGAATVHWVSDLRQQVEFIGEVSIDILKSIFRPRRMRWGEVMRVFEIAGVNALPIVCLLTFLIGMVISFESAQPLAQFGAQIFVANLLGLSITRELGPVMAAIMLAGRSGSAFAAELGTMKVNEELNALQTMGLSPIQFLVVQRVVAGILLTPLLTIYAMYAGLLGGIPVLLGLGFPLRMVLDQLQASLHIGDLAEGLGKSLLFGAIVASVSCLRGLQTGEGPRAVGDSTTRSVVSSILLIVLADTVVASLTTVLRK